jgi:hypothetical protein
LEDADKNFTKQDMIDFNYWFEYMFYMQSQIINNGEDLVDRWINEKSDGTWISPIYKHDNSNKVCEYKKHDFAESKEIIFNFNCGNQLIISKYGDIDIKHCPFCGGKIKFVDVIKMESE